MCRLKERRVLLLVCSRKEMLHYFGDGISRRPYGYGADAREKGAIFDLRSELFMKYTLRKSMRKCWISLFLAGNTHPDAVYYLEILDSGGSKPVSHRLPGSSWSSTRTGYTHYLLSDAL